jgi:small subunit ribosomal protein S17
MSDKKTKPASKGAKGAKGQAKPTSAKAAPAPAKPAPTAIATPGQAEFKSHSFRRKMIGTVTGNKMNKTVVVEVIRKAMDPMYKKYIRVRDRYKAHDEHNQYQVGDRVEITEHRPISRDKRWLVTRLLTRRVEA